MENRRLPYSCLTVCEDPESIPTNQPTYGLHKRRDDAMDVYKSSHTAEAPENGSEGDLAARLASAWRQLEAQENVIEALQSRILPRSSTEAASR